MISFNVLSCKGRRNQNVSELYCIALNITQKSITYICNTALCTNLAERMYVYIYFMALSLQRIRYDLFV